MLSIDRSMEYINEKAQKVINIKSEGWDTLRSISFDGKELIFIYGYDGMGSTTCKSLVSAEIFFFENIETILKNMRDVKY